jgi:hypothetical protein
MHCVAIFATKKGKEFAILYADFGHNTLRVARKVLLLFAPSVDAERTILGCPRGIFFFFEQRETPEAPILFQLKHNIQSEVHSLEYLLK